MPLRNGFLLLLLVISGCSSIGVPSFLSKNDAAIVTFLNGRDVANIPFTEINEQIVFDAVLNNNKKVRLLLDSGAQTSVLFETINIRKSSLKLVDSIEVDVKEIAPIVPEVAVITPLELIPLTLKSKG